MLRSFWHSGSGITTTTGCIYEAEDTVRAKEIAQKLGDTALNVGKDLYSLRQRGLAETEGESTVENH